MLSQLKFCMSVTQNLRKPSLITIKHVPAKSMGYLGDVGPILCSLMDFLSRFNCSVIEDGHGIEYDCGQICLEPPYPSEHIKSVVTGGKRHQNYQIDSIGL
ncbi:unnamed protein product [Lactuca virosa]|uniref:Uncharacterized protein n=1 Tax=Lactuca virosa TaxID=75947 RepID=A0AAU9N146_9ASTR|nr:unnamed protein product [Lactuca virosa]